MSPQPEPYPGAPVFEPHSFTKLSVAGDPSHDEAQALADELRAARHAKDVMAAEARVVNKAYNQVRLRVLAYAEAHETERVGGLVLVAKEMTRIDWKAAKAALAEELAPYQTTTVSIQVTDPGIR